MTPAILIFCALGFVSAVVPAVERFLDAVVIAGLAVGGGVVVLVVCWRELRSWMRFMDLTRPMPRPGRVDADEDEVPLL